MLLAKVVKGIEWLVFIGLCISSIMFSHQVWKQYESYDSSYKISVGNASESPTLIICFSGVQSNMDMAFEYGKDFNLSYIVDLDLKNVQILNEGINIIETRGDFVNGTNIEINYEVLDPLFHDGYCHKISSDLISSSIWTGIKVNFDLTFPKEDLPEVYVIISSGNNSYGVITDEFYDGAVHIEFGSFSKDTWMKFQPIKYVALDQRSSSKSKCQKGVYFYECFQAKVLQEIGNNCPEKCFPVSNKKFPTLPCKTEEERKCAWNIIENSTRDKSFLHKCPRSCVSIEFKKTYKWIGNYVEEYLNVSNKNHAFWYWYKTVEDENLYTEYLIYDANGMVGSIGGALGLFIGFSFSNVISLVFNKLQNYFYLYASQNQN